MTPIVSNTPCGCTKSIDMAATAAEQDLDRYDSLEFPVSHYRRRKTFSGQDAARHELAKTFHVSSTGPLLQC